MAKTIKPALEGWFSDESGKAHLMGSRCTCCGTYYFPQVKGFCRNPDCEGETFDVVPLSRTGKVWSYTNACYQPPEPFVAPDPFVPFTIAAVELAAEKMIVLGQVVTGVNVSDLKVGMEMELVIDTLCETAETVQTTWKWQPLRSEG
jgi:uncharacterized OB-fold protein